MSADPYKQRQLTIAYQITSELKPRATNPRTHNKKTDQPNRKCEPKVRLHQTGFGR